MIRRLLIVAGAALPMMGCANLSAGDPVLYEGLAESDVSMASRLVQTTLENAPDGATRRWTNAQTGNSGEITPLRTFANASGAFCREYREELAVGASSGRFYHTACRDEEAGWVWL